MSILWWIALCFGCLSKKQYLRTQCTTGFTWLTVGLTGLREVMHALFLFSSLFAFSCATFFNGHDSVMYWTEISLLERQKLYFLAKLWDSKILKQLWINRANWMWNPLANYVGQSYEQIRHWGNLRKKNLSFDFVGTILVLFASVERPLVPLLTLDVGVSWVLETCQGNSKNC